jgi:hypothetical protein
MDDGKADDLAAFLINLINDDVGRFDELVRLAPISNVTFMRPVHGSV